MRTLTVLAVLAATSCGSRHALVVERWDVPQVSSMQFESHAAFDPRTGDLWFVRSAPDFTGWRLLVSNCAPGWSAPKPAPFAGDGVEADPWFTPDGNTLWFISSRSTDGVARKDTDIWRVVRNAAGEWGTPQRLPAPVNSEKYEWFPREGRDGWLYFGSGRDGGLGGTDIWRAKIIDGNWKIENLGPNINTAGNEYEATLSEDGTFVIVETDGGYYRSERTVDGWSPKVRMDAAINVNGSEIGALLSPSGRTLLFSRDTKSALSGEFFIAHFGAREAWPPSCPVKSQ